MQNDQIEIDNKENSQKKLGLILCIVGGIIILIGIFLVGFGLGKIQSADSMRQEGQSSFEADTERPEEAILPQEESKELQTEEKDSTDLTEENSVQNEKVTFSSEDLAAPSVCGALRVEGSKLVDQNGNPVQLRGISSHGLSWFPTFINQESFRQFRQEWNVNVMRLAMYTAENGGYCTDGNKEDLKNIIYRGVQYATDYDMYVIIDWHVLQDQNPNKYKEEAKQFFDDMSAKYKDSDNIIYEICNEPNGGVSWSEIKSYAEEIIPVIRANDEDAIILVGTPNWSQRVDEAAADPITEYDNIMYTLHFYAATHKDDLRKNMVDAIKKGLPVFVSEYGICDASGNGALDLDSAQKWVDVMNENGVSYVCWALANKNESAALLKSTCTKTSQFTMEDLNDSGKWLYETLTGISAGEAILGSETSKGEKISQGEIFESGGLEGTIELKSKWDADGKVNYQYDVTLKNPGEQNLSSWAVDIHFSDDISLVSSWGGNYSVNGNTLHVTSLDYNGHVKSGETVKDLGFTVSGPSKMTITK